jgi:hypothetical protein
VPTSVEIVVILPMLERARDALDHDQPTAGRAYVDDAIRRLEAAKAAQDAILDQWAITREVASQMSLDVGAS